MIRRKIYGSADKFDRCIGRQQPAGRHDLEQCEPARRNRSNRQHGHRAGCAQRHASIPAGPAAPSDRHALGKLPSAATFDAAAILAKPSFQPCSGCIPSQSACKRRCRCKYPADRVTAAITPLVIAQNVIPRRSRYVRHQRLAAFRHGFADFTGCLDFAGIAGVFAWRRYSKLSFVDFTWTIDARLWQ